MWTKNFQLFKLGSGKAEELEIKLQTFLDHTESKGIPEKYLLCFTNYANAFDCLDHNNLENS